MPLRAISQAVTEFEFHISPACASSRPQVKDGTVATRSKILRREQRVGGQTFRAGDRLGEIGDHAVAPTMHLVAEDPEPSRPPAADSTLRHDAPLLA